MRTSSSLELEISLLLWAIVALLDPNPKPIDKNKCGSGPTTLGSSNNNNNNNPYTLIQARP
jgi:hypothetical protein